jgi:hypothetical protein
MNIIEQWMRRFKGWMKYSKPTHKPHRAKGRCVCGREITMTKNGKRFLKHKCVPFQEAATHAVAAVEVATKLSEGK